jgi:hypothetical protein
MIGPLNDLWKFNPSTTQWTWVAGSNSLANYIAGAPGIYGTKGTASATNMPGGRYSAQAWTDKSGNFWMLGGVGADSTGQQLYLNDLWMFNVSTGQWTWVSGNNIVDGVGVYGNQGVANAANVPGAREYASTWVDSTGNLWLFGGNGFAQGNGTGLLNDLWMFNIASSQWTWVSGSNAAGAVGVYGTEGLSNSANVPGARQSAAAWPDSSGNLWLLGGGNQPDPNTYLDTVYLNDLWVYSPSGNTWTWVAGSSTANPAGTYGTQGTPSVNNIPGGRYEAATWTDTSGNFWLMAGESGPSVQYSFGSLLSDYDDLWTTASVSSTPAGPQASLSLSTLTFTSTVGQTSAQQSVTLANVGSSTLNISGITLGGANPSDFAISANTCGSTLAAGANCAISVTFTPASATSFAATLSVADNATGSPQSVVLTGTGTASACVNDPATPYVNCNTGTRTVVSNSRTEQLTFASPTVTTATATAYSTEILGKYNGATVYDQTFAAAYGTPTVQAGITAANSAIVTAGGSSVQIPAPALTTSSTSTNTASTSIYSTPQPLSSDFVSTVTSTDTFGPATVMAEIANYGNPANPTAGQVSQCTEASLPGSTLPTCMATNAGTLQVVAGQLDVNTNTDSNYLINTATTTTTTTTTVAVYAINATPTAPVASLSPTSLSFSSTTGITSAALSTKLTNMGNAALTISGVTLSGANPSDFAITANTCGSSLASGANCAISVTFTPASAASFAATLTLTDNAGGSPQSVTLNGTGAVAPIPVVSLSPGSLSFTSIVGTSSAAQLATLSNTGNATLNISGIVITGASGFIDTTGCGSTLTAGSNCTISITYTPSATSSVTATLAVTDNATGSPHAVTLTGAGTIATAPVVSLSPSSLTFSALSGTTSAAQSITLQNTGNATLNISSIVVGGTNASVFADTTTGCGTALNAGASCTIAVTFSPTSASTYSATLTVADNASATPQSVALSGTGAAAPSFTLSSIQPTQAVVPGSAAVYTVTVTPQNGAFTGTVSLSASGLPVGATASFSPATLTPGSSAATSTLTIQTTTSIVKNDSPSRLFGWELGTPTLAFFVLLMRPRRRFRRGLILCLLALAALGVSAGLSGCGSAGFRLPEPANTTFNFTVTAASGTQQQTITVQLTVQ